MTQGQCENGWLATQEELVSYLETKGSKQRMSPFEGSRQEELPLSR